MQNPAVVCVAKTLSLSVGGVFGGVAPCDLVYALDLPERGDELLQVFGVVGVEEYRADKDAVVLLEVERPHLDVELL